MKAVWADLKNQNKYSFINKKKHEDSVTVTVKLAYDKVIVVAAEYSKSFSESNQSTYQERQQSWFLLPKQRLYKSYFYRFISWNDEHSEWKSKQWLIELWIQILNQAWNIIPTAITFSPVNTPGNVDCIMNWRFLAT